MDAERFDRLARVVNEPGSRRSLVLGALGALLATAGWNGAGTAVSAAGCNGKCSPCQKCVKGTCERRCNVCTVCANGKCKGPKVDFRSCNDAVCTDEDCQCFEGECVQFMISDRNRKLDFASVNEDEVLARVASLPISTWRYRGETDDVRHLGPMAQEFGAAFGLGASDKVIHPVDGNGVALAAIQALHRQIGELTVRLAALERTSEICPVVPADGGELARKLPA